MPLHMMMVHLKSARNFQCIRNFGLAFNCRQKTVDPIQQLFIDKLREYKSKSAGGTKLVEPTPGLEKELQSELEKAAKTYGGKGAEMTKFPTFNFIDPPIDPIRMEDMSKK